MGIDNINSCQLCGGAKEHIGQVWNFSGTTRCDVTECRDCLALNSVETTSKIDKDLYNDIYSSAKNVTGYDRYEKYSNLKQSSKGALNVLANAEAPYDAVARVARTLPPTARILEVGCGLGYTVAALRGAGFNNAYGTDISDVAVTKAKNKFGDYYLEFSKVQNEVFDLVYSTEVIEHTSDPVDFLRSALRSVKPGGQLLISTPRSSTDVTSAEHRKTGEWPLWVSDLPPVHLWCFTRKSLDACFSKLGIIDFQEFKPKQKATLILRREIAFAHEEASIEHPPTRANRSNVASRELSLKSALQKILRPLLPDLDIVKSMVRRQFRLPRRHVVFPRNVSVSLIMLARKPE